MTNNLNINKYQINESIKNEPPFDANIFNSHSSTSDPLTVVPVSLRGGEKRISTTVAGLSCLWDSRTTNIMMKRKHTKQYERKMRSNKVEYITAAGIYCTTHDVKVHFCMPEFSISKIIIHHFHVNIDKDESVIGYDMITCRGLVVQLGL